MVSRRVAALEARLGIRLLERSTRRVTLTEAGNRFRSRIREAADIVRAAEEEARNMAAAPTGLLRLSLPLAFGRLWIAPRLPEFLAQYPALRVEVSYTDRYVDVIAEGFDAVVRLGGMTDSRLVSRRIASTACCCVRRRPIYRTDPHLRMRKICCGTTACVHPDHDSSGLASSASWQKPCGQGQWAAGSR